MTSIKIDKIIRSRRRTIALIVSADASLVIRAPFKTPLEYINHLVIQKIFLINKKREQALKNGPLARAKQFVDGEEFLYLGESYKLKIEKRKNIELQDFLFFPEKFIKNAPAKMTKWYKQQAIEILTERARCYSKITGWKFKKLSINSAEKRWGSCSSKGTINFSWKLIIAPLEIIDYVVVHELAHIPEKNHSSRFWNKVESIMPDYKSRRKWLKDSHFSCKF